MERNDAGPCCALPSDPRRQPNDDGFSLAHRSGATGLLDRAGSGPSARSGAGGHGAARPDITIGLGVVGVAADLVHAGRRVPLVAGRTLFDAADELDMVVPASCRRSG